MIPQGPLEGDHMANGRVEMAVRDVKRQCRTLRISAEHDTEVRIADDSWLPRFAEQVMNKMRIGKDGKTREMRRTCRWWRKPLALFGEKVWFRKIGEDGVSSFASRMTRGIFVGHLIEQERFCVYDQERSYARQKLDVQTLNDASGRYESGRLVWHSVANGGSRIVEKLTKKVTADKEGAGLSLPWIVVERAPEVEPRRFYVLSAVIEAHTHTLEAAQAVQRLHRMDVRQSHIMTNAERESERSLREP